MPWLVYVTLLLTIIALSVAGLTYLKLMRLSKRLKEVVDWKAKLQMKNPTFRKDWLDPITISKPRA